MTQTEHPWQTIDTAPIDTPVQLGGYTDNCTLNGAVRWRTNVGIVWESEGWWIFKRVIRCLYNREYTHWKPLPAPPEE